MNKLTYTDAYTENLLVQHCMEGELLRVDKTSLLVLRINKEYMYQSHEHTGST